jgi:two-component system KDP operon response regulator KdpE
MTPAAALSKVLVVDDQPAVRRFLRASFAAQGYLVVESDTGLGTLQHLRGGAPDVLVLDLRLPDIDGL